VRILLSMGIRGGLGGGGKRAGEGPFAFAGGAILCNSNKITRGRKN